MIIISERINGLFRSVMKAIDNRDESFIQDLARNQVEAGAQILDINTGPGVEDAPEVMTWLVKTIQDAVDAKLSIDTPKLDAMEAGVKAASSSVLINSATAETKKMETLFPMAVEHDSDVICLTLDEKGIPNDATSRCELAMIMVAKAMEYGIGPEKLYLDPLILPVGAAQDQGPKVLEALGMFKAISDPPPKTVVGLSNVSNNTKERPLLNRTYLIMLMASGLDSAIMDPNDTELVAAIKASEVLLNQKLYADDFLRA
ncbi:MAG: dihydropteroate synthase DHPS [Methanomassiliicoccales archaeon]|nr:MAG: dihydropteroate synthase DHPS [Methanomassiliicoccales archaeon]